MQMIQALKEPQSVIDFVLRIVKFVILPDLDLTHGETLSAIHVQRYGISDQFRKDQSQIADV